MTSRRLWIALLVHAFLMQASYAAVRPMFTYRGIELGLDSDDLLLLVASFNVLPLICAFFIGRLADRHGTFVVLLAGTGTALLSNVMAVFASGLELMLVASALVGLGQIACIVGQQVAVVGIEGLPVDRGFGWLAAAGALGQVFGPPVVSVAAGSGVDVMDLSKAGVGLASCTVITGVAFVVTFALIQGSSARARNTSGSRSGPTVRGILSVPGMWQVMLLGGVTICALDFVSALLPLWADSRGVDVAAVGLLLGLRGAVTFASRLTTHRVVTLLGRRSVLALSAITSGIALAALPVSDLTGAIVIISVLGLGLGIIPPITAAWVSTAVAGGAGSALGLRLSLNRGVQVVLPVGIAVLLGGGATVAFGGSALLLLLAGASMTRIPPDPAPRGSSEGGGAG